MNLDLPTILLSLAVFGSAGGAIFASYHVKGSLAFNTLKPLATLLILIIVVHILPGSQSVYADLVAMALLFSLVGDIFLMLPSSYFARGILSFSSTHSLYFLAFASVSGITLVHPVTPLLGVIAVALATIIWQGVKTSLRIPVLLYIVLITAMATEATGAAIAQNTTRFTLAAAGALLFFLSDTMLAIDRFRFPFLAARAAVLSSYWIGQWLIAISTGL